MPPKQTVRALKTGGIANSKREFLLDSTDYTILTGIGTLCPFVPHLNFWT